MSQTVEVLDQSPLRGRLSVTGYELPPGLSFEEWAAETPLLVAMARSSMFWLGDHLRYGEQSFGERYAQAIDETGLALQTLRNAVWVCERIPPEDRRAELSFSHHRAVASLDPKPRRALLARAVKEQMTEGELLGRVRALKAGESPAPTAPEPPKAPDALPLPDAADEAVRLLWRAQDSQDWALVAWARAVLEAAVR